MGAFLANSSVCTLTWRQPWQHDLFSWLESHMEFFGIMSTSFRMTSLLTIMKVLRTPLILPIPHLRLPPQKSPWKSLQLCPKRLKTNAKTDFLHFAKNPWIARDACIQSDWSLAQIAKNLADFAVRNHEKMSWVTSVEKAFFTIEWRSHEWCKITSKHDNDNDFIVGSCEAQKRGKCKDIEHWQCRYDARIRIRCRKACATCGFLWFEIK